jgi:hypothetical protein
MDDNLSSIHLPPLQKQNSKKSNDDKVEGRSSPLSFSIIRYGTLLIILPSAKVILDSPNESSSEEEDHETGDEEHEKHSSSFQSPSKKNEKNDHTS